MSTPTRVETVRTGELSPVARCGCADDAHRWSSPVVEAIDAVRITRWRCTCPHCRCDGLHLVVDPADTGKPQHVAVR